MTKIFIILFGLFLFIAIFLGENRFFVKQYFQNNTALEEYFSENYSQAEKGFSGSLNEKQDEIILFNLANTFVKQALKQKDLQEKITGLEKSIEIYSQALEIKNHDFIDNNLVIATKLLENYKQKNNSGENTQQNNQDENQNNSQETHQDGEKQDNKDDGDSQNNQNKPGESGESKTQFNQLSNQQTQEIENYLEELKQIEKNNQQFFNKQQNSDDFFEKFSNDPFLQNEFNRGGEKDW